MRFLNIVVGAVVCLLLVVGCTGPVNPSGEPVADNPPAENSEEKNAVSRADWYISNNEALVRKLDECKRLPQDGAGDYECDAANEAFVRWYQASQNIE